MNSLKNLKRLQKLHQLIEKKDTGSPKEVAEKIGSSERMVHCLIEELKDYGANIRFDRKLQTYFYKNDFELQVHVSVVIFSQGMITNSIEI